MAIYHASFKIISRSNGSSAVASAAYRSGEKLINTATGEIHHYRQKQEQSVTDSFIVSPANSPSWVSDRQALWSTVEQTEKRKDAQLARELNVALPIELTKAQQGELIRDYVQDNFVALGMVADVCLHDLDSHNPHAHVMLTMRDLDESGFGKKNRDWNNKVLLKSWRENWGRAANTALEQAGSGERIDHRSYEDQGREQIPTIHVGHVANALEKRGVKTDRGNVNRAIAVINQQIKALTQRINDLGATARDIIDQARVTLQTSARSTKGILDEVKGEVAGSIQSAFNQPGLEYAGTGLKVGREEPEAEETLETTATRTEQKPLLQNDAKFREEAANAGRQYLDRIMREKAAREQAAEKEREAAREKERAKQPKPKDRGFSR